MKSIDELRLKIKSALSDADKVLESHTYLIQELYADDPDSLLDLSSLSYSIAHALDPIFKEISELAQLENKYGKNEYQRVVSDAIEGNLDFDLARKAEKISNDRKIQIPFYM